MAYADLRHWEIKKSVALAKEMTWKPLLKDMKDYVHSCKLC